MGERSAGFGAIIFTVLIFTFLMTYMVPAFRSQVPQGQLGVLETLTGMLSYQIVGAIAAFVIALGFFVVLYKVLSANKFRELF